MDGLIIIDVQRGMFASPAPPPHDGGAIVSRIRSVLDKARREGAPVFFVQHAGPPRDALAPGSPGFAFHEKLTPLPSESVTVKHHCSAFQDTDFDTKLRRAGVSRLVICGMQTEFCVDTAVRGAYERGYKVVLLGDAHTTFDTQLLPAADIIAHHNATLSGGFAAVKPAASIEFTPARTT